MDNGEGEQAAAAVPDTLILGLGNPLRGDDGVGVRLAQMLAGRCLPASVEVADGGTQGLGLVGLLEGRRRAIVIDAAEMGRRPGDFVRFTPDEAHLPGAEGTGFSVHEAGLREALLLAHALGILPDEVVVYGVQPARIEWDTGLSPQVEAALPALTEAVMGEVTTAARPRKERAGNATAPGRGG